YNLTDSTARHALCLPTMKMSLLQALAVLTPLAAHQAIKHFDEWYTTP
ncbi:MAG: hypothetical protein ACI81F_002350, partial [Thalassolituus oleivorans]